MIHEPALTVLKSQKQGQSNEPSTDCSGNRANSIYNRIFARSRTPKCAKLVLGTSAVHVRSLLCSRFFGVGIKKNEKRAILCEKGPNCELVSSSSSLDTASQREPAIRRDFLRARQYSAYPGACGYIRGGSSGHNSRDTDISVRYLRRVAAVVVLVSSSSSAATAEAASCAFCARPHAHRTG